MFKYILIVKCLIVCGIVVGIVNYLIDNGCNLMDLY